MSKNSIFVFVLINLVLLSVYVVVNQHEYWNRSLSPNNLQTDILCTYLTAKGFGVTIFMENLWDLEEL